MTAGHPHGRGAVTVGESGQFALQSDPMDRLVMAHDASHYLLTPGAVLRATSASEVADLLRTCTQERVPLTFRSGGTSLSGQGVTQSLLVDTRRNFKAIEVLDGGARVRVQPGVTVREANARLAPFGRKLGPDPASEAACTIGGVVANNSSGMACGTSANTYATLDSLVLVLPSGTVIDSAAANSDEQLRRAEPRIHEGLLVLRQRLLDDAAGMRTVRRLFELKNTMGYGINAFLDFERPIDILTHLIIGSEGTLAFVAEAVFRTVPRHSFAMTGLLLFDDIQRATEALVPLRHAEASCTELLDARSLVVSQAASAADSPLRSLRVVDHAALLVEFEGDASAELAEVRDFVTPILDDLLTTSPWSLTTRTAERAELWRLRKGLYAAVAGARPRGTTAILEDVAVPVERLASTCSDLDSLLTSRGYSDSVIFGHAKDGNIHFLVNEDLANPDRLTEYDRFTNELVDLILGAGGTLKAEHGTGRAMAPFVSRQYGSRLYNLMVDLKRLIDPVGIMNPDVIVSGDDQIHLANLKRTPEVEAEVDRCVECGYCEPVCPSKDLTLTPRQRIVLRREQQRAAIDGDMRLVKQLEEAADYPLLQTCAADGMCQTACPVGIDTGALVKRLRQQSNSAKVGRAWATAARHWGTVIRCASWLLSLSQSIPRVAAGLSRALRFVVGSDIVPAWSADLPAGGRARRSQGGASGVPDLVFIPSCLNSVFAPARGADGVSAAFLELCRRADLTVEVPRGINGICCGTPWKSKGFRQGYEEMRTAVLAVLAAAFDKGVPLVVDAASCTEGLIDMLKDVDSRFEAPPRVLDVTTFVGEYVVERIPVLDPLDRVTLHPTCSSTRLGINGSAIRIAEAFAREVVVPVGWSCCGFAGDRGMLHPELTAAATDPQRREIAATAFGAYMSLNRTCEIAMSRATGREYQHLLEVYEQATRPMPT